MTCHRFIAAVVAALALAGCGPDERNPGQPASPAPTQSEMHPDADLGAGTPGAPCATNRLGKSFVKDGVVYTCSTPKPYAWRP